MVMISVLVLLGLGLVTATVLAVASRVFHVEEDPRVQAVLEALPGANCGGCGFPGCDGLAAAIAAGTASVGACPVGGPDVADKIAAIMGV
ncbi:RnfABCDGE type electron transport complex subunit B, partial [uncultured Bilophila sp.]|uniref:RnfABCDGE type electron transport complex subunit B n=1 Tax=uncultured Bilophila sp. TaxID=529385 RepID=UPI0026018E63